MAKINMNVVTAAIAVVMIAVVAGVKGYVSSAFILLVVLWLPAFLVLSLVISGIELAIISWIVGFVLVSSFAYPLALLLGKLSLAVWIVWACLLFVSGYLRFRLGSKSKAKETIGSEEK